MGLEKYVSCFILTQRDNISGTIAADDKLENLKPAVFVRKRPEKVAEDRNEL